jgi:pimeloyl-ACP methyl ester carboxylesterase
LFRSGPKRQLFRRAGAAALAAVGALLLPVPASAAASCRDVEVPVTSAGLPQTVYGKLCVPAGGAKTVQVLVPGGTYQSVYWDFTYTPETRSYRTAMNNAGYATFALDRLGTGRSSKPLSPLVTAITQAEAVHGVVQAMRAGSAGPRFDNVLLAGHSLGSAIAIVEAGTYHDVDGVLLTGWAHRLNLPGVTSVLASVIPVPLDARMSQRGLDPMYMTTRDGTRYSAFHTPGPFVAPVIDLDESTKDVFAPAEMVDSILLGVVLPYSRLIDKPVLLAMGEHDSVFCGVLLASDCSSAAALKRSESLFYSPAARLSTYVLKDYGHSINYAPNAPDLHEAVVQWADGTVGH